MSSNALSFCGIAEDGTRLEGYFDGPMSIHAQLPSRTPEWVSLPHGRRYTNDSYLNASSADTEPQTATPSGISSSTVSTASVDETGGKGARFSYGGTSCRVDSVVID